MSDLPKAERAPQAAAPARVSQMQRDAARVQASAAKSTPASQNTQRQQAATPAAGLVR